MISEEKELEFLDQLPFGILVIDENDYIVNFNSRASREINLPVEFKKYVKLEEVCPILFKDATLKKEVTIVNEGTKNHFDIHQSDWKGQRLIFLKDKTCQEQLEKENALLKTVLDKIHEGVQISDQKGVTTFYNAACAKFEGLKKEDVLGKRIVDIYDVTEETSVHQNVLRSGKAIFERTHNYQSAEGNQIEVVASTFPFFDGKEVTEVYSINRDVTKMKEFISKTVELQKKLAGSNKSQCNGNGAFFRFEQIIGRSKAINEVINSAIRIAMNNSSVLIYGETGTGKELFAQSIHNGSLNWDGPFIPINCAAIPETLLESLLFGTVKGAFTGAIESPGLFEQAENGTLYLDEINSMSMHIQAKLLRVLQDKSIRRIGDSVQRKVNCRIISSSNVDPQKAVNDNQIRQDLYFRLAAVTLVVPPLAERKEDIVPLVECFIRKYNKEFSTNIKSISAPLEEMFMNYSWPSNVRELEHVIESAFNMVDSSEGIIQMDHLAIYLRKRFMGVNTHVQQLDKVNGTLADILNDVEKRTILQALAVNKGNISKTAKELGIFRQALQYRMKRFNISIGDSEEADGS